VVPEIDVMDTTWIAARPAVVAAAVAEPSSWRRWWPTLQLEVKELRGHKGVRWNVRSGRRARMTGTMELYLHPADDGVQVYYFLRLDGRTRPIPVRRRARLAHAHRVRTKRAMWTLANRLDPSRIERVRGQDCR
jgi:hypothetical protein